MVQNLVEMVARRILAEMQHRHDLPMLVRFLMVIRLSRRLSSSLIGVLEVDRVVTNTNVAIIKDSRRLPKALQSFANPLVRMITIDLLKDKPNGGLLEPNLSQTGIIIRGSHKILKAQQSSMATHNIPMILTVVRDQAKETREGALEVTVMNLLNGRLPVGLPVTIGPIRAPSSK